MALSVASRNRFRRAAAIDPAFGAPPVSAGLGQAARCIPLHPTARQGPGWGAGACALLHISCNVLILNGF